MQHSEETYPRGGWFAKKKKKLGQSEFLSVQFHFFFHFNICKVNVMKIFVFDFQHNLAHFNNLPPDFKTIYQTLIPILWSNISQKKKKSKLVFESFFRTAVKKWEANNNVKNCGEPTTSCNFKWDQSEKNTVSDLFQSFWLANKLCFSVIEQTEKHSFKLKYASTFFTLLRVISEILCFVFLFPAIWNVFHEEN